MCNIYKLFSRLKYMERISVKDCGVINKHFWKWHYFNSCSSCFVTLSVSCQECEKVSTIWLAEKNISPITLDDLNVARFIVTQAAFLWITRMGQKSKGACNKSSVGKSLICCFFFKTSDSILSSCTQMYQICHNITIFDLLLDKSNLIFCCTGPTHPTYWTIKVIIILISHIF